MDYQDGKAEKIYYKEKDITTEDFETCSDQKTLFDNNDLEIIVITDGVLIFNKSGRELTMEYSTERINKKAVDNSKKWVYEHEEQHVINSMNRFFQSVFIEMRLIQEVDGRWLSEHKAKTEIIQNFVKNSLPFQESIMNAVDEIIAFYRAGAGPNEIYAHLNIPLYDYLSSNFVKSSYSYTLNLLKSTLREYPLHKTDGEGKKTNFEPHITEDDIEEQTRSLYWSTIIKFLRAILVFEEKIPKHEILDMLMAFPPNSWSNIAKRLPV